MSSNDEMDVEDAVIDKRGGDINAVGIEVKEVAKRGIEFQEEESVLG